MFQTENRIKLPHDIDSELENDRFFGLLDRMVEDVYQDLRDNDIERTVQDAMMSGHLNSYYTPSQIVTPERVLENNHMRSTWFLHSTHLRLEDPRVLSFSFGRPPEENAGPYIEENANEVAELLNKLGQRAYLWTASNKLTVFTAKPSGLLFLPEDINVETQESESGLTFLPGADPGKISKRLRCYSGAPGVFFDPKPSLFPELNLGGEYTYRVKVRDSSTVGDGGGSCPSSIAREILRLSRAPLWGDIIAFQIVALAADYSFKGLINIIPDELWTEQADLLIDAKSVNHQVHSTKATLGKLMPTRQKQNKRYFYIEPINLSQVVNRFIDAEQLVTQVQVIAENLDALTWNKALAKSRKLEAEFVEETPETVEETPEVEEDNDWDSNLSHVQHAIRQQPEEKKGLLLAYEESRGSPFALPSVTSMVAEGPANSWTFQLKKSRKKGGDWNWEEGKPQNSTLSGIMISGEKLLLMDPMYAGTTYPRKGYVKLIWHPKQDDQLIGLGLSKADTLRMRDALDGMDVDGDKLQLIPMEDEHGKPMVLLMRSPMSIDGGGCLKLTLKDAARMRELGYHFYRQTGEHKYPGLYEIQDGEQIYPDMLHATPHENPPQWTTDPDLMVQRTLEMTQYRGVMGKVCLAAANLDFAGLYDPKKHKFNMSEAVIDPSLNASADPTPVLLPLQETILRAVREGTPLDKCIFPRISGGIRRMFKERHPGEEFEPVLTCQQHHHEWRQGQEAANRFLRERMKERALLAHGPTEWLMTKFRTKLYNLVVHALEERTAVWAQKAQDEKEVWNDEELNHRQKEARVAALINDAKEAEKAVVNEAYLKAVRTVDDLEPGQFMAGWVQAAVSRTKRFRRFEPVRTGCLLQLPSEEIRGFFRKGESEATAIIRTEEREEIPEGTPCYVEETQRGNKTVCRLIAEEDGAVIADLKYEARHYLELNMETAGYLPKIQLSKRKGNGWEQAPNQLLLRVTNPQNA